MKRTIGLWVAVSSLIVASAAFAGAPIKGVGVSLGKVPGGGLATRVTDANGMADFGALPVLPNGVSYRITFDKLPEAAAITILGGKGGDMHFDLPRTDIVERRLSKPETFASDGKTPLRVQVESRRQDLRQKGQAHLG